MHESIIFKRYHIDNEEQRTAAEKSVQFIICSFNDKYIYEFIMS